MLLKGNSDYFDDDDEEEDEIDDVMNNYDTKSNYNPLLPIGENNKNNNSNNVHDKNILDILLVNKKPLHHKNIFRILQVVVLLLFIISIGAFVFSYLESDKEVEMRHHFQQLMHRIKVKLNDTELYNELTLLTGHPNEKYRDFEDYSRSWMFSFTVVTTTGFGLVTPHTPYGQLFCVLYSFIGIPIAGICLSVVAETLLNKIARLLVGRKNHVQDAFKEFDDDSSGLLDHHEMRLALKELGFEMDDYQFFDFMREVDVNDDGQVDFQEFQDACEQLHINLTEISARRKRLVSTLLLFVFWLIMGTFVFIWSDMEGGINNKHGREWTWIESLYFCFTSLTTIGFGDYFPETSTGHVFLVFYCAVGLGMLSVLITLVQQFLSDLAEKAKQAVKDNRGLKKKLLEEKIQNLNSQRLHNSGNNNVSSSSNNYGIDESKKKATKKKTINFPTRQKRGTSMPAPVPTNLRNQHQDRLKKHKSTFLQ